MTSKGRLQVRLLPLGVAYNDYSRSKIGVFGGLDPRNGRNIIDTPKDTLLRDSASTEPPHAKIRQGV